MKTGSENVLSVPIRSIRSIRVQKKRGTGAATSNAAEDFLDYETDIIWKALSDPTRRTILDLLRDGPKTTTEIVEAFPDMTRHAVMKHINMLRGASLINTAKDGRKRENSLNPVPIRQIYERWMGPFAELWSSTLLRVKDDLERKK